MKPSREDLVPYSELEIEENTYYQVFCSMFKGNPVFVAILYTGFKGGGYQTLFDLSEIQPRRNSRYKIIKKLYSRNEIN